MSGFSNRYQPQILPLLIDLSVVEDPLQDLFIIGEEFARKTLALVLALIYRRVLEAVQNRLHQMPTQILW
jgi:hypothetical protein